MIKAFLPRFLKPLHSVDLIRLGRCNDGGYLVERQSVINSQFLLTGGLGKDFSFEKDLIAETKPPDDCISSYFPLFFSIRKGKRFDTMIILFCISFTLY